MTDKEYDNITLIAAATLASPPRPDASAKSRFTLDEIEAAMDRVLKRYGFHAAPPDASGLAREIWLNQANLQRSLSQEELKRLIETCSWRSSDASAGLIEAAELPAAARGNEINFWYKNHRGETAIRFARILGLRWGTSEYHSDGQWLLRAYDYDRHAEREFAVKDMSPIAADRARAGRHGNP